MKEESLMGGGRDGQERWQECGGGDSRWGIVACHSGGWEAAGTSIQEERQLAAWP